MPTVNLHVHERIDPETIIRGPQQRQPRARRRAAAVAVRDAAEYLPLRQAVEFYKHPHGWSNRLIAGDSLVVMNSLLEKEGMAGKVQMVYIDPPYGIRVRVELSAVCESTRREGWKRRRPDPRARDD